MSNELVKSGLSDVQRKHLDPSTYSELGGAIKGTLHPRGDPSFGTHSKLFNGDVISRAALLVRPFDTEDVSQIVQFCTQYSLSLSVKAGGYGTHGQAVQGDVIIDISFLNDISIEKPNAQGGFTSISEMPSARNAGKGRLMDHADANAGPSVLSGVQDILSLSLGKRRADEAFGPDAFRHDHWPTSQPPVFTANTSALRPEPPAFEPDTLHPNTRRRIWSTDGHSAGSGQGDSVNSHEVGPSPTNGKARTDSSGSNGGDSVGGSGVSSHSSGSSFLSQGGNSVDTAITSVDSEPPKSEPPKSESQLDPFGYMLSQDPPTSDLPGTQLSSFVLPPASVAQPYTQPGLSSSFSPGVSAAGHYMPTRVNPIFPHAYVTFGAGAKQKEVDQYSASHPLPATSITGTPCFTPYHVPFAAHPVGSSVMLLGGFGFLSRLHGLSLDNLVEAEVVLADGRIVVVNERDNPDLWWALRGAGPAFGIVTRYKAKAYPVPVVFAGNLLYKFRRSTAASLIKHFRDCVKNVPRELYANVILTAGPGGEALLVIQICYLGSQEQGMEFLQAITSWDGEQCLLNEVSEKSFLNQQDSLAQLINGKAGRKWFIRSDLLNSLSDETIHETVMRFADTPIGCTWLFELSGGSVSDDHGGCFPASSRQATWTVAAFHQWELDYDDPRCVSSAEDWIKETLAPASAGGPFPSFFGIHETGERVKGSFGDNWQRLCELKHKYDPAGFFRHNFWPLDENDQPRTSLVPTHTEF